MGQTRINSQDIASGQVTVSDLADDVVTKDKLGILASKGDLLVYSTEPVNFASGSSGQVLTSNPGNATGLLWSSAITVTGLFDSSNNILASFLPVANSVNYFQFNSQGAGQSPSISAKGASTDINIRLVPKGAGLVKIGASQIEVADISTAQNITNKNFSSSNYLNANLQGYTVSYLSTTTGYTLTGTDKYASVGSVGTTYITLPDAVSYSGKVFTVSNTGVGNTGLVVVSGQPGQSVCGVSGLRVNHYTATELVSNGSVWTAANYNNLDVNAFRVLGSTQNRWYSSPCTSVAMAAGTINVINTLYAMPFIASRPTTIDRVGINVTTSGSIDGNVRVGIFYDNGNTYPGNLLVDVGGSVTVAGVITGFTGGTANGLPVVLTPGLYWLAEMSNGSTQPILRGHSNSALWPIVGTDKTFPTTWGMGYSVAQTYGAMPSTYPTGAAVRTAAPLPAIFVRCSN